MARRQACLGAIEQFHHSSRGQAGDDRLKEVGLVEYSFQPDGFEVRHRRAPGQTDIDLFTVINADGTVRQQ
ncbi:hypothetical protein [Tardiphaga sp. OK245]|uniref:hypothetical protein n=1 Tax=Tardiphaga sp. OK245 TaxID=1855306 RepID=UPI0032E35F44